MRRTGQCPKCQSRDILRVPGWLGAYGAGSFVLTSTKTFDFSADRFAPVSKYVCGGCGFIEEWVDAAEDIAKIKKRYGAAKR